MLYSQESTTYDLKMRVIWFLYCAQFRDANCEIDMFNKGFLFRRDCVLISSLQDLAIRVENIHFIVKRTMYHILQSIRGSLSDHP